MVGESNDNIHQEHLLLVSESFGLLKAHCYRTSGVKLNGRSIIPWPKPYLVILISLVCSCEGITEHLDQEVSNAESGFNRKNPREELTNSDKQAGSRPRKKKAGSSS